MKTWRLRVVGAKDGERVSVARASLRYVFAWLWFLPPLALHPLFNLAVPQTLLVTAAWFALYAFAGRLSPDRQFLHDRLAGTRVVALAR